MVFHDVSQERRLQRALAYQASHDALTGLINRREFENRLNEALLTARSDEGTTHVLLYLDLDQFKVVNDTCGHQAGDRLLQADHRPPADAHPHQRHDRAPRRRRVRRAAAGLHCSTRAAKHRRQPAPGDPRLPLRVAGRRDERRRQHRHRRDQRSSESIGSVLSAADVACYAAKDSGRNRVHMYQYGAAPERHREMQWVSRLDARLRREPARALLPADRADRQQPRPARSLRAAGAHARRERRSWCCRPSSFRRRSATT